MRVLATIKGRPICQQDDGSISWVGEFAVDCDGSPRAYGPHGKGLDYLENAGHTGNWWGIVTDELGYPVLQGGKDPEPGCYISTTSYQSRKYSLRDPRRYLDAEKVIYMVVPGQIAKAATGIVLGCRCEIIDTRTGHSVTGLVGDLGPATHLGEASMAAAAALGLNPDPRAGGSGDKAFKYTFWPGQAAEGYELQHL
jgi:hypothetical protein